MQVRRQSRPAHPSASPLPRQHHRFPPPSCPSPLPPTSFTLFSLIRSRPSIYDEVARERVRVVVGLGWGPVVVVVVVVKAPCFHGRASVAERLENRHLGLDKEVVGGGIHDFLGILCTCGTHSPYLRVSALRRKSLTAWTVDF